MFKDLTKENLHHAHLLEGEKEVILEHLMKFIEKDLRVKTKGNPDFWHGEFDNFTIDDGRMLRELQMNKAAADTKKIFILSFNFITREAQNSLLKIFEEPTENTHFFVLVPSSEYLLPTLKSRMLHVRHRKSDNDVGSRVSNKEAESFLKAGKEQRMIMIKELVDEIADEKKSKITAVDFVNGLVEKVREKTDMTKASAAELTNLGSLLKCRDYLNDRSSSVKMILEHLALSLP